MNGGDAVAVAHRVAYIVAMGIAGDGAVIARGDDAVISIDEDAAYEGAIASRTTGDCLLYTSDAADDCCRV